MHILFCGDIMPGGVLPYQPEYITHELLDYLASADFRIGTLEAAIGSGFPFDPVKMKGRANIVFARNEDCSRLVEMGFDVVSLANNHVLDLGEEGLFNTIRVLKENGIQYCGAGMDIEDASRPAVIEKDGCRIAIIACCMYGSKYLGHVELAGKDKAGINPLDIERVEEDIRAAKRVYDRVIVLPHWGREYKYEPLRECVLMAKRMVDAGSDAVLGSHPHQIQPLIKYKGIPICFSMGNFLFPDFYMYPPRPIWYPSADEDLTSIMDVEGYPFPIEIPVRQIWNPVSRFGAVINLTVDESAVQSSCRYVHLSDANIEDLCDISVDMKKKLRRSALVLTNAPYRLAVKMKRFATKAVNRMNLFINDK